MSKHKKKRKPQKRTKEHLQLNVSIIVPRDEDEPFARCLHQWVKNTAELALRGNGKVETNVKIKRI